MKNMWRGKRVTSLLLSIVLLLILASGGVILAYSETPDESAQATTETQTDSPVNYGALIGATAQFNIEAYINFPVDNDPKTFNDDFFEGEWDTHPYYLQYYDGGEDPANAVYDFSADFTMVITDYYCNPTTYGLWFKVEAAAGHTLPEIMTENSWVFQNYADLYAEDDWETISADSLNITIPNGVYDAATGIVVKDVPDNAELVVEIPTVNGEEIPGVFDIKLYDANGNEWQPIDEGRTVTISIPMPDVPDGWYVKVGHFIDHVADINGDEKIVDTTGAEEAVLTMLAPYLEAYGDGSHVAVEIVEQLEANNGMFHVVTDSFSLFTSVANPPQEVSTYVIDDLNGQTLYVRPGEWFRLTTNEDGWLKNVWEENDPKGTTKTIDGGGADYFFGLFGDSADYFYVYVKETNDSSASTVGDEFSVSFSFRKILSNDKYTIQVKVVEDFDWGNTYITLLPHTASYPNEPSVYSDLAYQFYINESLNSTKNFYTQYPRTLIDVDALKAADYESDVNELVYGIVHNAGINTQPYLKASFDAIAEDMMAEYFAAHPDLVAENFKLVVYAIKHETVGDNAGWYIHCKVELKGNFLLSYEYNQPADFYPQDHLQGGIKKPNGVSATPVIDSTTGEVYATAIVGDATGMKMSYEANGKTYTATFLAWSTNATANPSDYPATKSDTDEWYDAGDTITMTKDTTLYAIWKANQSYATADVTFRNNVVDDAFAYADSRDTKFTFKVSSNFYGEAYVLYDAAGQAVSNGTFSENNNTFALENGGYVKIEDVDNDITPYTIEEINIPTGYSVYGDNAITTITITEVKYDNNGNVTQQGTNTAGSLRIDVYNTQERYTITYKDDETIMTDTGNPDSYTVEDMIILVNPTKKGYTFAGWTGTGLTERTLTVTITKGSVDDRTYVAHWTENTAVITYVALGPAGATDFGTVSPEQQTVGQVTGAPSATASVSSNTFKFVGWYSDADCTNQICVAATYMPGKNDDGLYQSATYYAKFEYNLTQMIIDVNYAGNYTIDDEQSFLFDVKTESGSDNVDLAVVVLKDGQVVIDGLTIGNTYTVTIKDSWSWRYTGEESATIEIKTNEENKVTFTMTRTNDQWLDGNDYHIDN